MKGNSISAKPLNESGQLCLAKTLQLLKVQEYGKGSVRNYMQELTLLFKHYNELQVEELRQEHIERYLVFIKEKIAVNSAVPPAGPQGQGIVAAQAEVLSGIHAIAVFVGDKFKDIAVISCVPVPIRIVTVVDIDETGIILVLVPVVAKTEGVV